jgi:hypothetical protein
MVERSLRMREARGSIPLTSIIFCSLGSLLFALALPFSILLFLQKKDTPGGDRTHDLRLRRPTPYPLGYGGFIMKVKRKHKNRIAIDSRVRTGDLLGVNETC